jgi:hypothetical protein
MKWRTRIDRAEKRGRHTKADFICAGRWVTCACGEQDPRIPRVPKGFFEESAPSDGELRALGTQFYQAVLANDYTEERYLLSLIERRASQILAEIDNAHSA